MKHASLIFFLFLVFTFLLLSKISFSANSLTISLNSSKVWWQDGILASGTLLDAGNNPINNALVEVKISGTTQCSDTTNATGQWDCSFTAPNEIDIYTVTAQNDTTTASTTLTVAPNYGATPVGTIDRVVYEVPMLIQDLTGKIKQIFVRITVWQGA